MTLIRTSMTNSQNMTDKRAKEEPVCRRQSRRRKMDQVFNPRTTSLKIPNIFNRKRVAQKACKPLLVNIHVIRSVTNNQTTRNLVAKRMKRTRRK